SWRGSQVNLLTYDCTLLRWCGSVGSTDILAVPNDVGARKIRHISAGSQDHPARTCGGGVCLRSRSSERSPRSYGLHDGSHESCVLRCWELRQTAENCGKLLC